MRSLVKTRRNFIPHWYDHWTAGVGDWDFFQVNVKSWATFSDGSIGLTL